MIKDNIIESLKSLSLDNYEQLVIELKKLLNEVSPKQMLNIGDNVWWFSMNGSPRQSVLDVSDLIKDEIYEVNFDENYNRYLYGAKESDLFCETDENGFLIRKIEDKYFKEYCFLSNDYVKIKEFHIQKIKKMIKESEVAIEAAKIDIEAAKIDINYFKEKLEKYEKNK